METKKTDIIKPEQAVTLGGAYRERVKRSPDDTAYRFFDTHSQDWKNITWAESGATVARFQAALAKEAIKPGDRVAIMLRNGPEWVQFEQAAIGMGLIVVPLYTNDRTDNIAYVLQDAGVKVLLIEGQEQLDALKEITAQMDGLIRILSINPCKPNTNFKRLKTLSEWTAGLPEDMDAGNLQANDTDADSLVTIVYTSGTTGRPKGVMLSHTNILFNAYAATQTVELYSGDIYLSFLPLSHMLERTVGYYVPMLTAGTVAFARSVQDLGEDLITQSPAILVSVPRIYERVYNKIHAQLETKSPLAQKLFAKAVSVGWDRFEGHSSLLWPILNALVAKKIMAKLGGNLRLAICGGAPLSSAVAKTFIGLGLNVLQGYGLTETGPIISANRVKNNDPASVGEPLPGVEVRIGKDDELLTRSPSVMLGYWNNKKATDDMITSDGWLRTGDKVRIENNHIYITGRLKDILVLSNGEKVPPSDMELAITMDPLFEQIMVIGEGRPYLSALTVLEAEHQKALTEQLGLNGDDKALASEAMREAVLTHIAKQIESFPGYAKIRQVSVCTKPWTIENGLITPTLKLKRQRIMEQYQGQVESLYAGH